jgi:hypothetical protein
MIERFVTFASHRLCRHSRTHGGPGAYMDQCRKREWFQVLSILNVLNILDHATEVKHIEVLRHQTLHARPQPWWEARIWASLERSH